MCSLFLWRSLIEILKGFSLTCQSDPSVVMSPFLIDRELVDSTIADMGFPPHDLAQVEGAFIGAGLL